MKKFKQFTEAATPTVKLTVTARDPEGTLAKLLTHIKKAGNGGHSFTIHVDPGDNQYDQKFYWDGDGADSIVDIKTESL